MFHKIHLTKPGGLNIGKNCKWYDNHEMIFFIIGIKYTKKRNYAVATPCMLMFIDCPSITLKKHWLCQSAWQSSKINKPLIAIPSPPSFPPVSLPLCLSLSLWSICLSVFLCLSFAPFILIYIYIISSVSHFTSFHWSIFLCKFFFERNISSSVHVIMSQQNIV